MITWQPRDEATLASLCDFIRQGWLAGEYFKFKEVREGKTRSQENLYRKWCRVAANHWKIPATKEYPDNADAVHDVFRHKFLGTSDRKVGKTVIPDQLVSTTSLEKSEMSEYMTKVEAFCAEKGLLLPIPGENEYATYREAAA